MLIESMRRQVRVALLQWPPNNIPEVSILPVVWVKDDVETALDSQRRVEGL